MRHKKYTLEQAILAVKESLSITECMNKLGINPSGGGGFYYFKKFLKDNRIDTSHFKGQGWNKGLKFPDKERPISDYLENKINIGSCALKNKLISKGMLKWECLWCGISEWRGERIALELDHIDGNRENNNLSNLRILCPNCHSQTPTYNGRKRYNKDKIKLQDKKKCTDCSKLITLKSTRCKKCAGKNNSPTKIVWPPKEELLKLVEEIGYLAAGRKLGVSDNAIRKRLKKA